MAKITARVLGGELKEIEANTVKEVMDMLNLGNVTASVNGEAADDDFELTDYEFVAFAPAVKGGC